VANKKDVLFVGIQGLLFLAYLWKGTWPFQLNQYSQYFFLVIAILGLILLLTALLQLNKNLSPFPTPKIDGQLIESGLYQYIRHPIYTGILLMCFGYAVYTGSFFRIGISIALWILFYFKSNYEEKLLRNRYPDYLAYAKSRGRFFPKLF